LAVRDKLIDFSTFLVEEYDYYMSKDKGYINVIVPGKVLAFSSPFDGRSSKGMAFKPSMFEQERLDLKNQNVCVC
jgi:hypothetical protein